MILKELNNLLLLFNLKVSEMEHPMAERARRSIIFSLVLGGGSCRTAKFSEVPSFRPITDLLQR